MSMLRRLAIAACLLASTACVSAAQKRYASPITPVTDVAQLYPAEIEYELLGPATGKACAMLRDLPIELPQLFQKERSVGHVLLYEHAKYDALGHVPNADALLEVRGVAETHNGEECVTVTGRAYRISGLRTRAAAIALAAPVPDGAAGMLGQAESAAVVETASSAPTVEPVAAMTGWHYGMHFDLGAGGLLVDNPDPHFAIGALAELDGEVTGYRFGLRFANDFTSTSGGFTGLIASAEANWTPTWHRLARHYAMAIGVSLGAGSLSTRPVGGVIAVPDSSGYDGYSYDSGSQYHNSNAAVTLELNMTPWRFRFGANGQMELAGVVSVGVVNGRRWSQTESYVSGQGYTYGEPTLQPSEWLTSARAVAQFVYWFQ